MRKNRKQWLIPALVIIPGIIISILGLWFVSQQKAARELNLKRDVEKTISTLREKIETESFAAAEKVHQELNSRTLDTAETSSLLEAVKSAVVGNPIVKHPFILGPDNRFIFPFPAAKGKREVKSRDRALTDPAARTLYRQGLQQEFNGKDLTGAIQTYLQCLNKSGRGTPYILNAVARCYFKMKKYHQALFYYSRLRREHRDALLRDTPFRFTVIRQEALTRIRLGQENSGVNLYLKLVEQITRHEKDYGRGQFEMIKNEALDRISRFRKEEEGHGDAEQMIPDLPELDGITPLDRVLNWRFTDTGKEPAGEDTGITALTELYTPNDEKTWFYRTVKDEIVQLKPEKGTRILPYHFFPLNRRVSISFKSRDEPQIITGFMIHDDHILNRIAPGILEEADLDSGARLKIEYDENIDMRDLRGEDGYLLASVPFDTLLNGYSLKVFSEDKDLFKTVANREMVINYALILFLVIVLVLGTVLFQKYVIRESELLRSKAEFIDRVSHTLKTPLTRMGLLAENILSGWTADEKKRDAFLRTIISETGRMNDTINNMLNFSQIDAGKKHYNFGKVSVKEIIEDYLQANKEEFEQYSPGIRTDLEEGLLMITGDRDGIRLILSNLVQNAIKYSPGIKDIRISLTRQKESLRLEVSDRGIGITGPDQKRIFEKFFRAKDSAVSALEGSGLGLFLAAHAAAAHGGRMEVESEPGEGAVFVVFLPLDDKMEGS